MTEVSFYHLQVQPLERALPKLLERALAAGFRVVVRVGTSERAEALAALLWTYDSNAFLPHGAERDGDAELQPIWITEKDENPNRADMLFLTDGAGSDQMESFRRCLDLFDGNDADAVTAARDRWKAAKAQGFTLTYWRQSESGAWSQAALS